MLDKGCGHKYATDIQEIGLSSSSHLNRLNGLNCLFILN